MISSTTPYLMFDDIKQNMFHWLIYQVFHELDIAKPGYPDLG